MKTNILVVAELLVVCLSFIECSPCNRLESLDISTGVGFPNGSIIHNGLEYTSDMWYEMEEEGEMIRLGCPCVGRVCLWKCCSSEQAFYNRLCADTDLYLESPFSPTVYKGKEPLETVAHQHFFYMYNRLCDDRYLLDSNSALEEMYIQENGTLYEIAQGRAQWLDPTTYCVDYMIDNGSTVARLVAAVCYPDNVSTDDSPVLYIAYAVGLLLSVPFLLMTFLVYAFIPELRNLHGMCLMAYCVGLIIAYTFLAYLKLHTGQIGVNRTGCLVIAFIVYYAFQTSFFWLNVMCFDIWRTFSGYRGGSTNKRRERKRFALYSAYAWGVPLLMTACTVGMQFGDELPLHIIRPRFGEKRCWFDNWLSELVYFFSPVLILVVCNVVLFSVTAHRIRSIKQETAILKGSESARSDKLKRDKQRYGLYLKLFMVMGVNWTVELISFAVGGSNWYWIVVDISNIMLGFFIFIIFVWKNKVRNLVRKRLRSVRGVRTATESSLGKWTTRSSSAPTEDTRVSADESAIRLNTH